MGKSFFKFALVFYPVFTFAPIGVHYSPLTALFLSVPGVLIMLGRLGRYRAVDLCFLTMAVFIVVATFVNGFKYGYGLYEIVFSLVPVIVGMSVYFYVSNMRSDDSKFSMIGVLPKVHYFVLAIGVVEVLCLLSVLPREIKTIISTFFSGISSSRIQLLTREASWASMYLLMVAPFVYYYLPRYRTGVIFLSGMLFLMIFSAYGILCAGAAYILFNFYRSPSGVAYIGKAFLISLVFIISVFILYKTAVWLHEMNGGGYHTSRVLRLVNVDSFEQLIGLDGSVFLRVMYPLYAIDIFLHNPLGVGVVSYPAVFNEYITSAPYADLAFQNPEILGDIYSSSADPRSFYTAVLACGGVGAFVFFVSALFLLVTRLNRIRDATYKSALAMLFFISLAIMLQFGTLSLLPFWLVSGLIVSATNDRI